MDYAIEIQRIIDALKQDNETNTKWKRWVIAGLERLQPWCLMLYHTPTFDDDEPEDDGRPNPADIYPQLKPAQEIPASLQQYAAPDRIQLNPSQQTPMPPSTQQPRIQ